MTFTQRGITYTIIDTLKVSAAWDTTTLVDNVTITSTVQNGSTVYTVTSIGANAFQGCTTLISINMPSSINSIGANAFQGCSSLGTLTIPSSVNRLPVYVCQGCTSLTSVTIPSSVNSIRANAFQGCTSLISLTIPQGVLSLGANSFQGCTDLETINISASVVAIGPGAFSGTTSLVTITVASSSTHFKVINNGLLTYDGTKLLCYAVGNTATSFKLPDTVTTMPDEIFNNCVYLTTITVDDENAHFKAFNNGMLTKDGTKLIGYAIGNAATSYEVPLSVTSIADSAFNGGTSLTSITFDTSSNLISIGNYAFKRCIMLAEIDIPESIQIIGNYAFETCFRLASITFNAPSNLTTIGDSAFDTCIALTSIAIPSLVSSIGNKALARCIRLTTITVDEANTRFIAYNNGLIDSADGTFILCAPSNPGAQTVSIDPSGVVILGDLDPLVTEYLVPASVTNIGAEAFVNCQSLETVTFEAPSQLIRIGENAFKHCNNLSSIVIPDTVETIGDEAFSNCTGLVSITIPESVTSIGQNAFSECFNLTSINIPASVTSIGSKAFSFCVKLNTITVAPGNTTFVVDNSGLIDTTTGKFLCCYKSIFQSSDYVIPSSVTTIDALAFYGVRTLTSITIPASVTSIGANAFTDCSRLSSITIPASVTSIGASAFQGCNLTSITVDPGNTHYMSVDNVALFNIEGTELICYAKKSAITTYTIPDTVTTIANGAFINCLNLVSITIPASVTSIGASAFVNCTSLASIIVDPGNTHYMSLDNVLFNYAGTELLFYPIGNTAITYTIPETVTTIDASAFAECNNLKYVTIPETVTSIGFNAFKGCNLNTITVDPSNNHYMTTSDNKAVFNYAGTKVLFYAAGIYANTYEIPSSVTTIGDMAFFGKSALTTITIPEWVYSIGVSAFAGCSGLTSITIPASVTSIGASAFVSCTSLTTITVDPSNNNYMSVDNVLFNYAGTELLFYPIGNTAPTYTIPDTVTTIDAVAFAGCTNLKSIIIPDSVTSIGSNAFVRCTSLTTITVDPSNNHYMTTSDNNALFNYEGTRLLTYAIGNTANTYTIPDTVTTIDPSAFAGCFSLSSITIPDTVTSIGSNVFVGCYGAGSITVDPSNNIYTSIDNKALFNYAGTTLLTYAIGTALTPYVLPSSVTTIGDMAFFGIDALTAITIPETVTSIGDNAFVNCSGLTSVTIPESVTSIGNNAFVNCSSLTSITIPESVTSIGANAFQGCNLTSIIVDPSNNHYMSVDNVALFNIDGTMLICYAKNSAITTYTIPDTVTTIGNGAFINCPNLVSITIPESVTSIGKLAFVSCTSLATVIVDPSNNNYMTTSDNNALFNYAGTELLFYAIGNTATSYTIPSTVARIDAAAFAGCSSLTSITIPDSVTSIGYKAFFRCTNLSSITFNGVDNIRFGLNGLNTFNAVASGATIYVMPGCPFIKKLSQHCIISYIS
jgi:hypothetical protein